MVEKYNKLFVFGIIQRREHIEVLWKSYYMIQIIQLMWAAVLGTLLGNSN